MLADIRRQIDLALREKDDAQARARKAADDREELIARLPAPTARRLRAPNAVPSEDLERGLEPAQTEELRKLAPQITALKAQQGLAEKQARDAEDRARQLNSELSRTPAPIQGRAVAANARARSRQEAEAEASRRLDQQIQQQIIRDAFRQAQ